MKLEKLQESGDHSTIKALLTLDDNLKIESVLMRYHGWYTVCLSVMVGCPLACKFCATGKMGFKRNLTAEEIIGQVDFWNDFLKKTNNRVSHVVFMGMGEPFLNWQNTRESINILNTPGKYNIAQGHITISTAGIIPGIYAFSKLRSKMNLAISLHSPFQQNREEIMPVAKQYPLAELMKACGHYVKENNQKIFFEFALIANVNDTFEDVFEIKKIFGSRFFHLNVIVLNPVDSIYQPSGMGRRETFIHALEKNKIPFTVRRSMGKDINAACGQLAY